MSPSRDVIVLGAGIVGLCSALSLQRDGHRVTVIDRLPAGEGTSYGNAGLIQVDAVLPIAMPGILRKVPRMLTDPEGPLVIRWRYLVRLAPWLIRFVAAARPGQVESISLALAALLEHAHASYRPLLAACGGEDLFVPTGELFVYRQRAAYEAAKPDHEHRRRLGIAMEEVGPAEMRQLEPALSPDIEFGVFSPGCLRVANPLTLSQRLAETVVRGGGSILQETVTDIERGADGPSAVVTDKGRHDVDRLVVAMGAFSKRWAARLGARVPLDTERGYHLMLPRPGVELRTPLLEGGHRFGITPMTHGVRLAGTAELASLDAPPNYRRSRMLGRMAQKIVPDLRLDDAEEWMGFRPSMPDSLPVIGPVPGSDRVFLAFGHGHLGLTLGAITGQLVADLVADRDSGIDRTPYRADRF